jgi:hypothetical protein
MFLNQAQKYGMLIVSEWNSITLTEIFIQMAVIERHLNLNEARSILISILAS